MAISLSTDNSKIRGGYDESDYFDNDAHDDDDGDEAGTSYYVAEDNPSFAA